VPDLAKTIMLLGLALFAVGAAMSLIGKVPWLGRLPGDIAIERENLKFYFPLGTSLLLSIVLSLVFWLLRR
jgi:hypothetical protein